MVQYIMGVPLRPAISAIRERRAALQIQGGSEWVGERERGEIECGVRECACARRRRRRRRRAGVEAGLVLVPSLLTMVGPLAPHKRQVA